MKFGFELSLRFWHTYYCTCFIEELVKFISLPMLWNKLQHTGNLWTLKGKYNSYGSHLGLGNLRETVSYKEMGLFNLSKSKGQNLGNIYSYKKPLIYLRSQLYLHDIYKTISSNCSFFSVSVLISAGIIYFGYLYFSIVFGQFFKQPGFLFIN